MSKNSTTSSTSTFNCINQDALTNLIQDNFFSFLAIYQPPGKIIQCRAFFFQLWLSRVKFESIVMKKEATTVQSSNVN